MFNVLNTDITYNGPFLSFSQHQIPLNIFLVYSLVCPIVTCPIVFETVCLVATVGAYQTY